MLKTTLIIPTHNEEDIVSRAILSVDQQKLKDLSLEVIIIPNGCVDKTVDVVNKLISKCVNPNISWRVELLPEGQRTKALNTGIALSTSPYVMYLNPDCVLENTAVYLMFDTLDKTPDLKVLGMHGDPELSSIPKDTILHSVIRIRNFGVRLAKKSLPVGRFIAFKKEFFPVFPEELHSEDTWLGLYAVKSYGTPSIKIIFEPHLMYLPYTNWVDFMKIESRYIEGTNQVFAKYPELEIVFGDVKKNQDLRDAEKIELYKQFCIDNGIDTNLGIFMKDFLNPIVKENTKLISQISSDGRWELVKGIRKFS